MIERLEWKALVALVDGLTGTGYDAVGGDTLIVDDKGTVLTGPAAVSAALDGVVAALEAEKFSDIAAAHSAADSYLAKVAAAASAAT